MCWLSVANSGFSFLPSRVNESPLLYPTEHCSHLSSSHFSSSFHHLRPSNHPLPQTRCVYMFPSSSLALVTSSLLLNLFLPQSVSLLSSILMFECESSLRVLLYFLGSAVVDWNGGLCHFYLLPRWFHNSLCVCVRVCICWCVVCVCVCVCRMIAGVWTAMRCVWEHRFLNSLGLFKRNCVFNVFQ